MHCSPKRSTTFTTLVDDSEIPLRFGRRILQGEIGLSFAIPQHVPQHVHSMLNYNAGECKRWLDNVQIKISARRIGQKKPPVPQREPA